MRILFVDDDNALWKTLAIWCEAHHMPCEVETTVKDGLLAARLAIFDAVILGLTDAEGMAAIPHFAKAARSVIVLSLDSKIETKVKALGLGADDYMVRPFHLSELGARLHACVRRRNGHAVSLIQIGDFTLDLDNRRATVGGRPVRLTNREYQMLECLVLRQGRLVSKQALQDYMYGGIDEPELKIIDVYVCKLRRVLRGSGVAIETMWGRGFYIGKLAT